MSGLRIRITGTRDELTAAVAALATVLAVREISEFYPNRGASVLGRVYLDAGLPACAGAVAASAERTGPPALTRRTPR